MGAVTGRDPSSDAVVGLGPEDGMERSWSCHSASERQGSMVLLSATLMTKLALLHSRWRVVRSEVKKDSGENHESQRRTDGLQ